MYAFCRICTSVFEPASLGPGRTHCRECIPKQRELTLRTLVQVALRMPDLRVGQLLVCATGQTDLFNVSDAYLYEALWRFDAEQRRSGFTPVTPGAFVNAKV